MAGISGRHQLLPGLSCGSAKSAAGPFPVHTDGQAPVPRVDPFGTKRRRKYFEGNNSEMKIGIQLSAPVRRHSRGRNSRSGVLLVECIVYISVVTVLLGVGMAVFWKCWDGHNALRRNADDIVLGLRVGEQWRADIRAATGTILVEKVNDGERLLIPSSAGQIIYTTTPVSYTHLTLPTKR